MELFGKKYLYNYDLHTYKVVRNYMKIRGRKMLDILTQLNSFNKFIFIYTVLHTHTHPSHTELHLSDPVVSFSPVIK